MARLNRIDPIQHFQEKLAFAKAGVDTSFLFENATSVSGDGPHSESEEGCRTGCIHVGGAAGQAAIELA
jgi:hypothetical protein